MIAPLNGQFTADETTENHRILVIDDNPAIHKDFRKILCPIDSALEDELDADEAALFGNVPSASRELLFQLDSAYQGEEGLEMVRAADAEGMPYAVAFVDVRMPPGWDGIETITRIWAEFPDLQVVICTAYSDYSWDEISRAVGNTDHVLVLKKPFDNVEVMQMAHALSKKWELTRIANRQMAELDALVGERTTELRQANKRLKGEVAERTAAEKALRFSEERFSKAFHGSPVPMAIQKTDSSKFLDINESFVTLLESTRDAVLESSPDFWNDPAAYAEILSELGARHTVRNYPTIITTARGETCEVLVAADNLDLGEASYHLLIVQDITDRVRLEGELRQAQKMEAVGQLAAGVAHDFNNILTVILGNASMHLTNPEQDEKLTASLQQVVLAAERATGLTRQLLAYSRKQIIQRRSIMVNGVIEQTAAMLRRVIGENIVIDLQLGEDLPAVFADSNNVDQVVMNLALNARDAMPDGGKITFTTSLEEIDDATRELHPEVEGSQFVCFSVRDTGYGMDLETLGHIFEPFFTTKASGKGTGMGLATVYGIVRQHNGWIDIESKPGRGATFRAYFPVCAERPEPLLGADEIGPIVKNPLAASGEVTILVVEDEDMLRELVCEALTMLGYNILSAANGKEALHVWGEHRGEIDLLLTDVVMPESISGRELAQRLLADRPDLKVVFTSGYSAELIGPEFEDDRVHAFLPKPYLTETLAKTVAAHLEREPVN